MGSVATEGSSDVYAVSSVEQVQQTVSDCRQNVRRRAGSNAALVFAKRDVAHVENRILDLPVSADHAQQGLRIGLIAAQRGDAIMRFGCRLAAARSATGEFESLRHERPF